MYHDQNVDLTNYNSFSVPANCLNYFEPTSLKELSQAIEQCQGDFYVLGEGSNTLFVDEMAPNIICPKLEGITTVTSGDSVYVTAQCGENWHELVQYCVYNNFHGIENLALIPGSVGAAPIQNIGAYGVELSDVLHKVSWFEFQTKKVRYLTNLQCEFGYRDSIFKKSLFGKGVILSIELKLSTEFTPTLTYKGLMVDELNISARGVMENVMDIRKSKLPDPNVLPNAGSFFKNPIVDNELCNRLIGYYPDMPHYFVDEQHKKLAAGWLIECAGLKGIKLNGVGVHEHQALVLVNYDGKKGQAVVELAKHVQEKVLQKFDVQLEPEVRFVNRKGLTSIKEC